MSRPGPWVWWSMQPFEDNEPERVPWWRRFVRMWNDLGFYRDIFTNVLATGLVAVLAYAYAIGAGYVKSPSGKQTLLGIWNVAVIVFVFILILVGQFQAMFHDPKKYGDKPRWQRVGVRVLWWVVSLLLGLGLFQAMTGVFNDVWWAWPFNTEPFHVPMSNNPH